LTLTRNQFIEELKKSGIGASVHFIPLHLHPFYGREYGYRRGDLPEAEDAYSRCLSLPIFPDLSQREMERVVNAVIRIVEKNRKRVLAAA
jgi:perosamine synthetase